MANKRSRDSRRRNIHRRIRSRVSGNAERPRLCVFRSLRHISAQLVDDSEGRTLASATSLKLDGKKLANGGNVEAAKRVGQEIASLAKAKGVETVVFDRGGYIFHGRVKALATAAREAGLRF